MQSPDGVKAIAAAGVRASYPGGWRKPPVEALKGVDLHAGTGEIMGLLGPNGSGKSTLMRILAGLARQDQGAVSVLGGDPSDRAITRRVGYLPEESYLYPYLDARETLRFYAALFGLRGADREAGRCGQTTCSSTSLRTCRA